MTRRLRRNFHLSSNGSATEASVVRKAYGEQCTISEKRDTNDKNEF